MPHMTWATGLGNTQTGYQAGGRAPQTVTRLQQDLDEREARGLGEHADELQHDAQHHKIDLPI